MARRLQPGSSLSASSSSSITVNALHPGIVRTELWRYTVFQPLTLMATPFTLTQEQVIWGQPWMSVAAGNTTQGEGVGALQVVVHGRGCDGW
jgi:NAD(P)-dependent dehydrogenase (short-subunit alcohol dehydrogenase family)